MIFKKNFEEKRKLKDCIRLFNFAKVQVHLKMIYLKYASCKATKILLDFEIKLKLGGGGKSTILIGVELMISGQLKICHKTLKCFMTNPSTETHVGNTTERS